MNTPTLTPADLASRWGCHVGTLANMRSAGRGPAYLRPAGRVVYRLEDVEAFEAETVVAPVTA